jgi:hypothetical protein
MTRRVSLIFALCIAAAVFAGPQLSAQTKPAASPAQPVRQEPVPQPSSAAVAALESDARAVREQLRELMNRYPPELGRVLRMDSTLLRDANYLARYPAVAAFLSAHPEIAHNPDFYLAFVRDSSYDYTMPVDARSSAVNMWRNVLEWISVFVMMVFFGSLFAWLVKTGLDHRRWLRVSRVQTEVHNKLLDRFAGTGDLLAYVQTPAGRQFLEAAPIPLDAPGGKVAPPAPISRILWSVQAGVVMVVGGVGFQFVSGRIIEEVAEGLWMIGVLATAFGVGFILSGAISYLVSRRLGLIDTPPVPLGGRSDTTAV